MDAKFYKENRSALYRNLKPSSMVLIFSGEELRKTNDEDYPFFANRNFVYLTGVEQKRSSLRCCRLRLFGSISANVRADTFAKTGGYCLFGY